MLHRLQGACPQGIEALIGKQVMGGNLFLLSLKKANACYDAMISRCYEGELPFWEEEKQLKIWQVALLAAYEGSLIMLFLILR